MWTWVNSITVSLECDFCIISIRYIVISDPLGVLLTGEIMLFGKDNYFKPRRCHSGNLSRLVQLHSHRENTQSPLRRLHVRGPESCYSLTQSAKTDDGRGSCREHCMQREKQTWPMTSEAGALRSPGVLQGGVQ